MFSPLGLNSARDCSNGAHSGPPDRDKDQEDVKPVRYSYGITTALLAGGAAISLITGMPAGAQVAQNDDREMTRVVPRAGAPASFADLTAQLQPAVVNISTRQRITVNANPFAGTPFADLFGNQQGAPTTREAQSLGSGFVISADGYVVTNNHVIQPDGSAELEEVTVTTADGTEYQAEVVGRDAQSDLAVLKVSRREPFPFVHFGDSGEARVGDWVIAIGNPFGLGGTVTSGIVSAVLRNTGTGGAYDRYIQTDASINRGNSGGPLFDMQGNVIGINNAIFSPTGGSQDAQIIRAEADAQAAKIYAEAYGKDPDFYDFYRAMQSYDTTFAKNADGQSGASQIILSPDNEYLRQFRGR